jgi:dihydrofolate reductase
MAKQTISIIAAMDEKRGIGKDNKIPWHLRDDLVHLKKLIKDQFVILGRKTFESLVWYYDKSGRPMPAKLYIIVTHNKEYRTTRDNTSVVHSLDEAFAKARQTKSDEIFVIGGQKIFEQAIHVADKLYLTIVKGEYGADAFFPDYAAFTRVVSKQVCESEGYQYSFIDLARKDC